MKKLHVILALALLASVAGLCAAQFSGGGSGRSDWNLTHVCTYCHDPHGNINPHNLLDTDIEVLCLTCHGPGGISTLKADVHVDGSTCVVCHDPHKNMSNWRGGVNLTMVGEEILSLARIQTPSSGVREVVFESRGSGVGSPTLYSFADGDEDGNGYYDGVCETCHTTTSYHRNDATGNHSHNVGDTCTSCHPHEDGFMATGGSCTECHNSPQDNGDGIPVGGRRAVVGEFSLRSHHVVGAIQDGDCVVCHDMSQHQQGHVRLVDVDDPGNDALIVELLDDPMSNATEAAKLEAICLSCHDSDGAAGSAPFTGGVWPPIVDATAWQVGSHVTQVTCFGNGIFGCHASGHGSEKDEQLAPYDVAPTGPDFAEEEEGFCFTCHDGSPASTDLAGEFAKGTNGANIYHHPVVDSEQIGSRAAECTLCHNPHQAAATNVLKGVVGVDLDGNPVGPGTGNDRDILEYELCFACHGDTFNQGRPGTSNKRTDFALANSSHHAVAAPGRNTSSNMAATLIGGLTVNSTLACSDCHNSEQTADANGVASNSAASPQGPHGSTEAPVLRGFYWSNPNGPNNWDPANYELCFLCHDVDKMFIQERYADGARTNFLDGEKSLHFKHINDWASDNITCANCHYNVHSNENAADNTNWRIDGILYTSPPPGFKTRMISFSPEVTSMGGHGKPTWELNTTSRRRNCYVNCHGKNHNPENYTPNFGDDDSFIIQ